MSPVTPQPPRAPRPPRIPPRNPQRIPQGPSPRRRAGKPELTDAAVVSRSWGMALATLVSRITGFFRIVLLAAILGAALSSSFSVANQLPNMIAALVLEATFTAIFVPVLARAERDDADGGTAFVRRLLTLATTLLLVATVISVVAAPLLVHLMLGDDPQVNRALTTAFAYLLLPQIIFYGLSSVFMAILNTRNVFGPPAWAPVVNNIVAIGTLGLYLLVPGELSLNPVEMGNGKLLVLGIGTTLGVVAQTAVLFVAIRRERVSLRPLWGLDARIKKFGTMAGAMVLYVLISQAGLIVGNQIASTAAASGPAIYNYAWLVLMLPFGMIGVTVLTVVMPRLSRNAAADDQPAVLADLSFAMRLTMVTLIPVVAFMTVAGPAIGSALFAYGNFGDVDAGYLGMAISLSAFTLIPYSMVLLQLRVFYAREQPWTPILLIIVITAVKIIASLATPFVTDDPELIAGYLGLANGLGFLAGAGVGHVLLRANLKPPGGRLISLDALRTILVTIAASLSAGLVAHAADRLLGLASLTEKAGGGGSILRLVILGFIMLPITATVLVMARVPDAQAAVGAIRRRLGRGGSMAPAAPATGVPDRPRVGMALTYADPSSSPHSRPRHNESTGRGGPQAGTAETGLRRGPAVTDDPAGNSAPDAGATTRIPRQNVDDFQPDVPVESHLPPSGRPPADYGGDPTREPTSFGMPNEPAIEAATADDDVHLVPGATIAGGRYRLLVFHGGPPHLQFWHAVDTVLDRQVALTFVDPDAVLPDDELTEILSRTKRLSTLDMPGIARVLDVARTGSGGLVVSEWIRGGSLAEVAETAPSAIGGARAIQSLAAAAEAAHRAGVALSIDHPGRIRVSIDGDVALAFPATLPAATPEGDIRGIGAALYALLVNRWPLPEPGVRSGIEPADVDSAGEAIEPRALDRAIPFQISAAAIRAVQENGGIRSAPTLRNLLQQATSVADRTDLISPIDEHEAPPARPRTDEDPEFKARRKRGVLIGAAAAGAILVVALIVLATVLRGVFSDVGGSLDKDELGLNAPSSNSDSPGPGTGTAPVKPVRATVFSPGGEADNPADAGNAIDGSPTTTWQTDTYSDAVPFPNFKNGVGLILELPKPTAIASVTLSLNSTGTSVQIRSAQSATPSTLEDTTVLSPPTPMKTGSNTISIDNPQPVSNVLVWITTLGTVDGKSETAISDIVLKSAS
ncbi:murein biosynthesis integral membrane protein MurJ [Mycolicibacterium hodleri]